MSFIGGVLEGDAGALFTLTTMPVFPVGSAAEQAIKRGSLFTWSVVGHVEDEVQEATFHAILSAFLRRPVVGSGRRVQWGRFEGFAVKDFDHLRPAEVMRERDPSSVTDPGLEKVFTDYILSRGDEVKEWLLSVQA